MSSLLTRALEARNDPRAPMSLRDSEFTQCLLYAALDIARRTRMRMDRMAWGAEYADVFRQNEQAIETAKRHLRALREASVPLDELLASMCRAEGIEP